MSDRLNSILKERRMTHNDESGGNSLVPLHHMVEKYFSKDFNILEIGTYEGASTELFALCVAHVTTVDPYELCVGGYQQELLANLREAERTAKNRLSRYKTIERIKGYSSEVLLAFAADKRVFDAVYIDGDHRYEAVLNDIYNAIPLIKDTGYIAGHDYYDEGVKEAILLALGGVDASFEDGSWIIAKKHIKGA